MIVAALVAGTLAWTGSSGVPERALAASGPATVMASDFVAEVAAQNPIELDGATILGDLDLT